MSGGSKRAGFCCATCEKASRLGRQAASELSTRSWVMSISPCCRNISWSIETYFPSDTERLTAFTPIAPRRLQHALVTSVLSSFTPPICSAMTSLVCSPATSHVRQPLPFAHARSPSHSLPEFTHTIIATDIESAADPPLHAVHWSGESSLLLALGRVPLYAHHVGVGIGCSCHLLISHSTRTGVILNDAAREESTFMHNDTLQTIMNQGRKTRFIRIPHAPSSSI